MIGWLLVVSYLCIGLGRSAHVVAATQAPTFYQLRLIAADAKTQIGALSQLSAAQISAYQAQVDAALETGERQAIVTVYQAAQAANAKKVLIQTINANTDVSSETKTALVAQANAATDQAGLAAAQTAFETAVQTAKDAKKDLDQLKTETKENIEKLTNLDTLSKGNYQYAVDQAQTKTEVSAVFVAAKAADAKLLADAKAAAVKTVNALTTLSDDAKAAAVTAINKQTTLTDVTTTVDKAKADDKAAALKAVKETAIQSVNSLKYLSNTEDYIKDIQAATTPEAVQTIVANAVQVNLDAGLVTDNIAQAKEVATQTINSLADLTAEQKVNAVAEVKAATTLDAVKKVLATAKETNFANGYANGVAKDLADKKADAVKTINDLPYLTAAQKADYASKVNAAETTGKVAEVVTAAKAADTTAKQIAEALQKAKNAANTEIAALPNLKPEQKATFFGKVLNATSENEVDTILLSARKLNLDQTTDKEAYRAAAINSVNSMNSLIKNQKAGFEAELKAATTIDEMKATIAKATAQNATQNDTAVAKEIDKLLASDDLSAAQQKIKELQLDTTIATYTAKVEAVLALRSAKEDARKVINDANYLTPAEKTEFVKQVNAATSTDAVATIVKAATAKAPAEKVQMYRAYNPNSGEHLYTIDKAEFDRAVAAGWANEGNAWVAASKGTPVYRLYNPNSGEHFYTVDTTEYNKVAAAGWTKEGVVFYSADSKAVNVYRLFNPNATGAGSHHFTTDAKEVATLVQAGWKSENIAFFGL